jgi:hypothetical protein
VQAKVQDFLTFTIIVETACVDVTKKTSKFLYKGRKIIIAIILVTLIGFLVEHEIKMKNEVKKL